MKVYIDTLGCKVNFADSAELASLLSQNGYKIVNNPSEADLYIINSCSVTHRAERDCRQIARRFYLQNPSARIIITGCSVLSNSFKERINEISFASLISKKEIHRILGLQNEEITQIYYNRSRPFIKIQEGCNRFCSYCIVPFLRGSPVSISKRTIISRVKSAIASGFQEIVLVGTHIMLYKDPETGKDLFDLIDDIELLEGDFRIRLSSIEPYGLSEERIRGFSRYKRLCPHFHIPLQSGSDKVLMDMKRDYKTSDIRKVINYIKELMPDSIIGADIITGYPTEDSDDFEKTLKFIQSEPIDYLHVFRFSPRPGTFAARIRPLSSESEVKIRSETLIRLSREKRIEAAKRFIGKEMGIVITSNSDKPKGLTHNYLKVVVNRDNLDKGKIYNARLLSLSEDGTIYGEIL